MTSLYCPNANRTNWYFTRLQKLQQCFERPNCGCLHMHALLLCFKFIHHTFEVFLQFFSIIILFLITFVNIKRTACKAVFQPWTGNFKSDCCVYLLVVVEFRRCPLFLHSLGCQDCLHLTLDHALQTHHQDCVFLPQHPVGEDDINGGAMTLYSFHIHHHTIQYVFIF